MKKLLLLFAILLCCARINAQSLACPGVNLNLQSFNPIPSVYDPMIDYGCINAAGKNVWYGYFTVCQQGTLNLSATIYTQDSIGMVVWGPFTDTVSICQFLSFGTIEGCDPLDTITTSLQLNSLQGGHIYMVAIVSDTTNFFFQSTGTAVITGNCTTPPGPGPGCNLGAVDLNTTPFSGQGSLLEQTINYGCVNATGQRLWYGYFTVCQGGTLTVGGGMSTSSVDADITVWGPFTSTSNLCSQLTAPNIVGCGASSGVDQVNLGTVTYGQVYMIAIACDTSLYTPYFAHTGSAVVTGSCTPPPPCAPVNGFEMLCLVTVDSATQEYQLIWNEVAGNPATHFGIMKEDFMGVPQQIDTVQISSLSQYIDVSADPAVHTEHYSIITYDTCGSFWQTGGYIQPVFCQSSLSTQGTVNVTWCDYIDYSGNGPLYYVIYRGATPQNMAAIDTVATFVLNYTDVNPLPGMSYYKIGVGLNNPCIPMRLNQSAASVPPVGSFSNAAPVTVVGIGENSLQEVSLFPNPSDGNITVKNLSTTSMMKVYDLAGRIVVQQQLQPNGTQQVSLENLESGMYSVTIENESGFFREEVVIR